MPGVSGANLPAQIWADVMKKTVPPDLLADVAPPVAKPGRQVHDQVGARYVLHELKTWLDDFLTGATN
jgi:transposase